MNDLTTGWTAPRNAELAEIIKLRAPLGGLVEER